jgi:hypothetical protein
MVVLGKRPAFKRGFERTQDGMPKRALNQKAVSLSSVSLRIFAGTIRPRLEQVGLSWVNFQVLRRTNASLSRQSISIPARAWARRQPQRLCD